MAGYSNVARTHSNIRQDGLKQVKRVLLRQAFSRKQSLSPKQKVLAKTFQTVGKAHAHDGGCESSLMHGGYLVLCMSCKTTFQAL
eukprot:2524099-Amphidinium_carterae.1